MKISSDKIYEKYKDYDFSDAKPVNQTPHLAKLQAQGLPLAEVVREAVHDALEESGCLYPGRFIAPVRLPIIIIIEAKTTTSR